MTIGEGEEGKGEKSGKRRKEERDWKKYPPSNLLRGRERRRKRGKNSPLYLNHCSGGKREKKLGGRKKGREEGQQYGGEGRKCYF